MFNILIAVVIVIGSFFGGSALSQYQSEKVITELQEKTELSIQSLQEKITDSGVLGVSLAVGGKKYTLSGSGI